MDSLTQIVLGAAVGEAVAGRKIGNRAMLWGAVAGTIPDLDVIIGSVFMDDLSSLAFHRGFMHSFTFAILFSIFMTFLVKRIYDTDYYQRRSHRISVLVSGLLMMLLMVGILNAIPLAIGGSLNIWLIIIGVGLISVFSWRLWINYFRKEPLDKVILTNGHWYLFFLLTIFTHPILDCFTTYGTQILQPFSDLRVSWDNISVFDPLYTAPFLICLLIAAFLKKGSKVRAGFNIAGLVISSIYMIWTFSNKRKVNEVFQNSLVAEEIPYTRYITTPTIANNILWNCVAETDSFFYIGFYSLLDSESIVKNMDKVPINKHLTLGHEEDESIKTLQWFSNGYNSYTSKGGDKLQVNDLRFGRFRAEGQDPDNFVFTFDLTKNENQEYKMTNSAGGPPRDQEGWIQEFFARIKGI